MKAYRLLLLLAPLALLHQQSAGKKIKQSLKIEKTSKTSKRPRLCGQYLTQAPGRLRMHHCYLRRRHRRLQPRLNPSVGLRQAGECKKRIIPDHQRISTCHHRGILENHLSRHERENAPFAHSQPDNATCPRERPEKPKSLPGTRKIHFTIT